MGPVTPTGKRVAVVARTLALRAAVFEDCAAAVKGVAGNGERSIGFRDGCGAARVFGGGVRCRC